MVLIESILNRMKKSEFHRRMTNSTDKFKFLFVYVFFFFFVSLMQTNHMIIIFINVRKIMMEKEEKRCVCVNSFITFIYFGFKIIYRTVHKWKPAENFQQILEKKFFITKSNRTQLFHITKLCKSVSNKYHWI